MLLNKRLLLLCLLILFFIASTRFYNLNTSINIQPVSKVFFYVLFTILLLYKYQYPFIVKRIRDESFRMLDLCILFLIFGLLFSIFNSFIYKSQPLIIGFMASLPLFIVYSFYFWQRETNISINSIEKIIVFMGGVYCMVKLISFFTMPSPLFGTIDENISRGAFRFRIPGMMWAEFAFFLFIGKYINSHQQKYLYAIFFLYLILFSSLTRQVILWSTILGLWFIIQKSNLWKKIAISIFVYVVISYAIPHIPIVQELTNFSKEQYNREMYTGDNRRLNDYKVFLYEYKRNVIQYLCGCGLASEGNSQYGQEIRRMAETKGIIAVDAGWAGFVFYYGYIPAIILLSLFIQSIKTPIKKKYLYIKFFLIYVMLRSIASGTILYYDQLIIVIIAFYMTRKVYYDNLSFKRIPKILIKTR